MKTNFYLSWCDKVPEHGNNNQNVQQGAACGWQAPRGSRAGTGAL